MVPFHELLNFIGTFLNGLGQRHSICSFEKIVQILFPSESACLQITAEVRKITRGVHKVS